MDIQLKSKQIVPNVLYIASVDEKLTLGKEHTSRLMGVFLPTLRSIMYMDSPGRVDFTEGDITITYITLQSFLKGIGKGDMDSILLAYSYTNPEAIVYKHPLWEKYITSQLGNLVNFDLYGISSIIYKYLRHFEYTKEYIEELKHLREEIQEFDRDDSISDIIDLIDWSNYRIVRPYRSRRGENHHTQVGIDMLGRKIQDVRVDVLIDRIDMDIGDYYKRNRELTPDILRQVFIALYIYGHLTFRRHISFPLPSHIQNIMNRLISQPREECLRCLFMKFSLIDEIDIPDNFFYMHARKAIDAFYRDIYGLNV
ncbi:hypothetical protein GM182_00190 [bacterium 3DAC]|nr:hypothetical protein [Dictyoglomota bacterium]UZN22370.1 hypothetical protein GM182_00190 [bacterium 3DAC]